MTWFERLTGFSESGYTQVQSQLQLQDQTLRSLANGRSWHIGRLETPSLAELRTQTASIPLTHQRHLQVQALIADAYRLHTQPESWGSVIQVASQFNLLEMVSPHVSPEDGVSRYEFDRTQGPACAMACGAGTIYRNYFAKVSDASQAGQTRDRQFNTLSGMSALLNVLMNRRFDLPPEEATAATHSINIRMVNGYALLDESTLQSVDELIRRLTQTELDNLRGQLQIGAHWHTQVTAETGHSDARVTQAYCSALPISYNASGPMHRWELFARLVLEAAYEATLHLAVLNATRTGNRNVYLTMLGAGAFGNPRPWVIDAIQRAIDRMRGHDLNVSLVCYGHVPKDLTHLLSNQPR